jgi:hypothetical protein
MRFTTRETVAMETRARLATSWMFTFAWRRWEDFFDRSMRRELYAFPGVSRSAMRTPHGINRSNTESYAESSHFGIGISRSEIAEFGKRFLNRRIVFAAGTQRNAINQCID